MLDVGCATGYSSAVLAQLAGTWSRWRRIRALARSAARRLRSGANVAVVSGPLAAGWPPGAPYDAILLEGASEVVPDSLFAQLKDGGRLLAVVGSGPMGKATIYRTAGGTSPRSRCSMRPRRCCRVSPSPRLRFLDCGFAALTARTSRHCGALAPLASIYPHAARRGFNALGRRL